jgi:NDP-sugar pyrophosphorylase family protein
MHGRLIGRPFISGSVYVGHNTIIEQGAFIKGPAWIGDDCEIRNGAYVRENAIIGNGCVLGNSSEFKNCILFNNVQVPHFNYVGDAILGYRSHLGAGVILSNVKLDHSEVSIPSQGEPIPTGLRKFSALVGDFAEIGCNSVINPGSIIGRNSMIYPGTVWRGVLPHRSIVKTVQTRQVIESKSR